MVNADAIFIELSTAREYRDVCKRIANTRKDLADDLHHHVLLIMMEMNREQLIHLYSTQRLKYYFVRVCMNEFRDKYSKFNKLYRHMDDVPQQLDTVAEVQDEDNEYINRIELYSRAVDEVISVLPWYDRELFRLYNQEGSMRKLANKTRIPVMSICNTINQVKSKIKQHHESILAGHRSGPVVAVSGRQCVLDIQAN